MKNEQNGQNQSQSMGAMSQKQAPSSADQQHTGEHKREVPEAQAAYGNSQDESGRSEQDAASEESGKEVAQERAIPGEVSRRPDQQARADANPALYEG